MGILNGGLTEVALGKSLGEESWGRVLGKSLGEESDFMVAVISSLLCTAVVNL